MAFLSDVVCTLMFYTNGCKINILFLVHALYSKSGGKNGKHNAVSEKSNIVAVSYMVVQLYEPVLHTVQSGKMVFRDRPDRLSLLQVKEYALMTSPQFLTVLLQKPTLNPTGLDISEMDSTSFSSLNRLSPLLKKAVDEFKKRGAKEL
jgi:hypothetical protein